MTNYKNRLEAIFPDTFDFDLWWITPQPVFNELSPSQAEAQGVTREIEALVSGAEAHFKNKKS
jgi:hypothetical protein